MAQNAAKTKNRSQILAQAWNGFARYDSLENSSVSGDENSSEIISHDSETSKVSYVLSEMWRNKKSVGKAKISKLPSDSEPKTF